MNHYLITLPISHSLHMHCYLMCEEGYEAAAQAGVRMVTIAEEHGVKMTIPTMILSTKLDTGVEIVREFVCQMPDAKNSLEMATDFHCTVWVMRAPEDERLMELH